MTASIAILRLVLRPTPPNLAAVERAAVDRVRACDCGQPLADVVPGHCTRCGIVLREPRRTGLSR